MDHKCQALRDWNSEEKEHNEYHHHITVTTEAYWGDEGQDYWRLTDYDDVRIPEINFCPFCGRDLSGKIQRAEEGAELRRVAEEEKMSREIRHSQLEYIRSHPEITAQWLMLDGYRKTSEEIQAELQRDKEGNT